MKREFKEKMPHFSVRLPKDTAETLLKDAALSGRSVSEVLRILANRYAWSEENSKPVVDKLAHLHLAIRELGRDLETVTRLFLVAGKLTSEDDAKDWCKQNLKVGR
jgi:hypothetical protein